MRRHVLIVVALATALSAPAAGQDPNLRVHLPRSVRVPGQALRLCDVAVIRGEDAARTAKAEAIEMGRAPFCGEQIVLDRRTILSRLALHGLGGPSVQITGADQVVVLRQEQTFPAAELVSRAEEFLKSAPVGKDSRPLVPAGAAWRLVREPKALAVPAAEGTGLQARAGRTSPPGHVLVEVAAAAGQNELGRTEVLFKLTYPTREVVSMKDIPAGQIITPAHADIRTVMTDQEASAPSANPFGMAAAKAIPAGTVIRPAMVTPVRPVSLVRRKQAVTMRLEGSGYVLTALGEALEDGRAGDVIKVRNADSSRVVSARVRADGTVEPVCDEVKP